MKKILLLLLSFFLVQCSLKRNADSLGPDACPTEQFALMNPFVFANFANSSTTALDLISSHAVISATFNEVISYQIVIKGLNSGAEYTYSGKSNSVNLNWYGNSTNGKYFAQGEFLSCKLTNICKAEPLGVGQLTLTTNVGYNGFGLKVLNFEENPPVSVSTSPANASINMIPSSQEYTASPQGGNYRKFLGTSANLTWYFASQDINGINYTSLGSNPNVVYLNFFAKGKPNSQCYIDIKENVSNSILRRKFAANVSPEWKLYSVKLSDIGIINPSAITNLSLILQSATSPSTSAEIDVDLVIFTFDKPF